MLENSQCGKACHEKTKYVHHTGSEQVRQPLIAQGQHTRSLGEEREGKMRITDSDNCNE